MKRLEMHVEIHMYDTSLIQQDVLSVEERYKPNIDRLMKLAEETNTIMEINANPKRLDLNAETVKKYPNVTLTINTDAHHIEHLDFMKYGVATAQKGLLIKIE